MFANITQEQEVGVCYFNEDLPLQNLRDHIVNAAHQELEEKILELKQLIEWYKDIQRWAAEMDHDYKHTGLGKRKHIKQKCKKCKLESTKNEITVHEWSLPEGPCQVALVVFELNHPVAFDMWHSVICLLLDICSPPLKRRGPHTCLRKYSTLLSYHAEHTRSRIMLASDVKPIIESHYCSIQVLTEESKVCINNGLSFYYYDKHSEVSPVEAFHAVDISVTCSHQLPPGSYQNLQHFLQDTTHTSNQWLNILQEIHANTLTLCHDEVHMLFTQAASQAGPISDDGKLMWHVELEDEHFHHLLLGELTTLVLTVSGNWLEGTTMEMISFLVGRMLSVTYAIQDHTHHRALELLCTVREKMFSWVLELCQKLEQSTCEVKKEQLRGCLHDLAAICHSTFDMRLDVVMQLLNSSRALEILLSTLSRMSRLLMEHDCCLSWKLAELVGSIILEGNDGIDLGIKHTWPGHHGGTC
ncbi:hypothetical protein EDD17DRAFT_1509905 [Pisolithus thermaeus]|nr:hypothetical protein EV401DRAFT_2164874 [Pisolithus croceorrhizus]KAI6160809.1 hypothetical protein EDD17DRAFT_1509905 [Pisolithus thermaeus]